MTQTPERQLELLRNNLRLVLRRAYSKKKDIKKDLDTYTRKLGSYPEYLIGVNIRLRDIGDIINNIEYITGVTLEEEAA